MARRFVAIASFLVVSGFMLSHQQVVYGQITSPATNSFLIAGSSQKITWDFRGDPTRIVLLQFTTDGGRSWSPISSSGIAAGSYNWIIPVGTNSYLCKVRLVQFDRGQYRPLYATGIFSIARLNPRSEISSVFSHRVISLTDTTGHHFNRVRFFR